MESSIGSDLDRDGPGTLKVIEGDAPGGKVIAQRLGNPFRFGKVGMARDDGFG